MTDRAPQPSVDELLDRFITAWHAGEAPSLADYAELAAEADRAELVDAIGAFLQLAPTVEPTPQRALELIDDPLVHKLALLEDQWWDKQTSGATQAWGARLRLAREQAGLSLRELGDRFAAAFGLRGEDATNTEDALARLERGELASSGVAARAARALEDLLQAPRGALLDGAAPPVASALMRGTPLPAGEERERLAELLRDVNDALPPAGELGGDDAAGETLHGLLGA